ncbi:TPA: hypothetical protein UOA92_000148 [Stenotrophomonas maltophilia]|uniref:hypothetical protein n=1 Tax=Stenotrophomonas maltophilia TaxID=40324 RepID=UPI0024029FBE|nr:hypothetical protein [Stenotrophomonas maltophilia]HEL5052396.1 hypothetical protein [Stenotrophomonas maltophilia]
MPPAKGLGLSDPNDRELFERLRCQLIGLRERAGGALFLLVDPSLCDPFSGLGSENPRFTLPLPSTRFPKGTAPYLMQAGAFGRDPVAELSLQLAIEQAGHFRNNSNSTSARSMGAWIVLKDDQNPMQIASALARSSQLVIHGERRTLRFWDPRVMDLLNGILDTDQHRQLLAPILSYAWMRRDFLIRVQTHEPGQQDVVSPLAAQLQLSTEQVRLIQLLPDVNLVLASLEKAGCVHRENYALDVARNLRAAEDRWQMQEKDDRVAFAICCGVYGDEFWADPEIGSALSHLQGRQGCMALVINQLAATGSRQGTVHRA